MSEDHQLRPSTPYAAAKAACDHLVQSMVNTFELDAVIVRPEMTMEDIDLVINALEEALT